MTTEAAQLQFAAEFTLFIAAVAAVAVTALRPDLLVRRPALRALLVTGALAMAAAAFLHGSLLVDDVDSFALVALRSLGIAGLAVGVAGWRRALDLRGPLAVPFGGRVAVRISEAHGHGGFALSERHGVARPRGGAARVATLFFQRQASALW